MHTGSLVLPEPFQNLVITYGAFMIYFSIAAAAYPSISAIFMAMADRDRDISRNEPWEEEPNSTIGKLINQ